MQRNTELHGKGRGRDLLATAFGLGVGPYFSPPDIVTTTVSQQSVATTTPATNTETPQSPPMRYSRVLMDMSLHASKHRRKVGIKIHNVSIPIECPSYTLPERFYLGLKYSGTTIEKAIFPPPLTVDLSSILDSSALTPSLSSEFFNRAGCPSYIDGDGDWVVYLLHGDPGERQVHKYVNGIFACTIEKIHYDWTKCRISDQDQYGGTVPVHQRDSIVRDLKPLADACGIPNNLPQLLVPTSGHPILLTFRFDGEVSESTRCKVLQAMAMLTEIAPALTFEERPENGHLLITDTAGDGCWAYLGYISTGNRINLARDWQPGGAPIGTILHELLHFLGVP